MKDTHLISAHGYIPELMFLDHRSDPRRTVAEFKAVETELNNVTSNKRMEIEPTWEWCYAALKLRQGNIYMKKIFGLMSSGKLTAL